MTQMSTQDILKELFPDSVITNLRDGMKTPGFGPAFTPNKSNEQQLAELRRVRRRGRKTFGANPTFNSDKAVLSMFDQLDSDIQDRAARGDYALAGSKEELAYMMGFDIEARKHERQLDEDGMAVADAITLGKFSPRAIYTDQSIRKLMKPLSDAILNHMPVPESRLDAINGQTAMNGILSDAQRVIEAQPNDATKAAVAEQITNAINNDAEVEQIQSQIKSETRDSYEKKRSGGLVFSPEIEAKIALGHIAGPSEIADPVTRRIAMQREAARVKTARSGEPFFSVGTSAMFTANIGAGPPDFESRLADLSENVKIIKNVMNAFSAAQDNPDRPVVGEAVAGLNRGVVGSIGTVGNLGRYFGSLAKLYNHDQVAELLDIGGSILSDAGSAAASTVKRSDIEGNPVRAFVGGLGEAAPQFVAQVGLSVATGGLGLPAQIGVFIGTAAAPVVANQFNDALEYHLSKGEPFETAQSKAADEASVAGLITIATSIVPGVAIFGKLPGGNRLLSSVASKVIGRAVIGAVGEGAQEMSEKVLTDSAAALLRNDPLKRDRAYWESVLLDGAAGAVFGFFGGAAVESLGGVDTSNTKTVDTDIDTAAKEVISSLERAKKAFVDGHKNARDFIENASPEALKKIRAKWLGRVDTDAVAAGFVEMIDEKLQATPQEATQPTETAPVSGRPETPVTTTEPKTQAEAAVATDKTQPQTELDDFAMRASDRGLAEDSYELPDGIVQHFTPQKFGDGYEVADIDGYSDTPRILTWAEAVAEADRLNVEVSGVEGAIGIKNVSEVVPQETTQSTETASQAELVGNKFDVLADDASKNQKKKINRALRSQGLDPTDPVVRKGFDSGVLSGQISRESSAKLQNIIDSAILNIEDSNSGSSKSDAIDIALANNVSTDLTMDDVLLAASDLDQKEFSNNDDRLAFAAQSEIESRVFAEVERQSGLSTEDKFKEGIETADDRNDAVVAAFEKSGFKPLASSRSSTYFEINGKKIRVSDHDPRPAYERQFGEAFIDINTGDSERGFQTDDVRLSSIDDINKKVAGIISRATEPKTQAVSVESEVFLRKPNAKEKIGGTARSRGFYKLEEAPDGFENVYKPYGNDGAGYYRIPIQEGNKFASPNLEPPVVSNATNTKNEVKAPIKQPNKVPVRTTTFRIPNSLGKPKPRFGRLQLVFESDLDLALYIVANSAGKRSKKDADFLRLVRDSLGISDTEARRRGDMVRTRIKTELRNSGVDHNTAGVFTVKTTNKRGAESVSERGQTTDPDAPNFDRRGFSVNFAAEAANTVLKSGVFTFKAIRKTVAKMLSAVSSSTHGLFSKIVNLTSRIVGKSVNPDGTINEQEHQKAVEENNGALRARVDPNRWLPADRTALEGVGKLRNLSSGAISRIQDAAGRYFSHLTKGGRFTPRAQVEAARNGFFNAILNVIEDPLFPSMGDLSGAGNYSGDRMDRTFALLELGKQESVDLRMKTASKIAKALSNNKEIASAEGGMSNIKRRAHRIEDRVSTVFDRLQLAKKNLNKMKGEAAEIQRGFIAALTERAESNLADLPADVRAGIERALLDRIISRNENANKRRSQLEIRDYLNRVMKPWREHAVVQFNPDHIKSAEDFDTAMKQIYGKPDSNDESLGVGAVVRAVGGRGFGTVTSIDGDTAKVRFINPTTGASSTKSIPVNSLLPSSSEALMPTRRRIEGTKEVSTVEYRDSAWWKNKGKDINFPTDRQFILDSMNAAQIAVPVTGETPMINDLILNPAVEMADIDSARFISGKRRMAVINHYINLANTELGLKGKERLRDWDELIEYAFIMRDEAGADLNNRFSEQQQIAAMSALRDVIAAVEGVQISREDATALVPVLFQVVDNVTTGTQLVFAAASVVNEGVQTLDMAIKNSGIPEGIAQAARAVTVNFVKGMTKGMKSQFEELAWGLAGLDEQRSSRIDETILAAGMSAGGQSTSTSQKINEEPGISNWVKGFLLNASRAQVNFTLSGKVGKTNIPLVRQTSLDFWAINLRQVGVLAETGVLMKRIPDLAKIHAKLKSGEAKNPGQAIKQLRAEKKLRNRKITPLYYALIAPRMGPHLARLSDRLETGEGVKRMFGMNVFVGNEASDLAVKRYLDTVTIHIDSNTPRKSDIPLIMQKKQSMQGIARLFLKYFNQILSFMNGRFRLTRLESSRGSTVIVAGLMAASMFDLFIRDVIRHGFDGAVDRLKDHTSTPSEAIIYFTKIAGRANLFGVGERLIVPPTTIALSKPGFRRSNAAERLTASPALSIINDSVRLVSSPSSASGKRLINRFLGFPNTIPGTLLRQLQLTGKFPGSFIISDEDKNPNDILGK